MKGYAIKLGQVWEHQIPECLELLNQLSNSGARMSNITWDMSDFMFVRNVVHIEYDLSKDSYHLHVSDGVKLGYTEIKHTELPHIIKRNTLKHIVTN